MRATPLDGRLAKTDPAKGHKGTRLHRPDGHARRADGEAPRQDGPARHRHVCFALTDVVVPAANRIGEEGEGFKIAMQTLDFARPGTAAGAVGVAQAAYEYAVDYAKQRVTFDVLIAMHQGVNFMIADMATEIAAARLLVWQAACTTRASGRRRVVVREALLGRHGDEGDSPTPSRSSAATAT